MEPAQTDELNVGTGLTVFSGTVNSAMVVDNLHAITAGFGLGQVIAMAETNAPPQDWVYVPTDGITKAGVGRVLIGQVPEPGTAVLLMTGFLFGVRRLRAGTEVHKH
jgi:hypothetical protein